ncbi:hypothetical protein E8P82_11535 [Arthrobacter echini]|uniref:Uncharacterized protein n=2 Tax=Arthrobacter echini TaxID=1529066 RepID=A0A5D0XHG5_9MICC|nr:hypothetical protein [Arthrobacter echini]THJ65604.1 hypothetical protein E8P82_11535 [Arthrobacter echini]TYC96062.1 hypothetical protein FQ377_14405 [Arthrobacter echini]
MNIELLFSHTDPAMAELQQRTERSLTDLAPYANITLVKIGARQTPSRPVPQNLPALVIEDTIVPADPPQAFPPKGLAVGSSSKQNTPTSAHPLPSQHQITAHLTQALLTAGPRAIRLPLVHRRIVGIALLLMLTGALSSPFLALGPVLTFIGLLMLPIGLASNGTRSRRQPLMLTAAAAAFASAVLLLWYFGPLLLSDMNSATSPAPTLFNAALACLGIDWAAALTALLARRRLRRKLKDRLLQQIADPARAKPAG